jgi:hypothetical protein
VMNGIVRIANSPVKLIDTLRSEIAKEALRHSYALYPWSTGSLETLAEKVAAAEVLVATPEYQVLVGTLEAAFAPASISDIKRELGLLFACYPSKDVEIGVLVACAVEEVTSDRPNKLELQLSCRRIRRTSKFRPSIAEIVEAPDDVEPAMSRAGQITELPKRLDVAASALCDIVGNAIKNVERLLSDRERHRKNRWRVGSIDEQLNKTRRMLENVSAHRAKALEPQRLLITQSISITENEKATTENHAVVELEDDIPW